MFGTVLLLLLSPWSLAQTRVISGTVVDAQGNPHPTASVSAWPVITGNSAGDVHWVNADKDGHFHLNVFPGRYLLRAKDTAALYPDPSFALCRDPAARFPTVTIRKSDLDGAVVKLGHRGALLKIAISPVRGGTIPKVDIRIRDAHHRMRYVQFTTDAAGRAEFVVPSRPLLIEFGLPGVSEPPLDSKPLILQEGQTFTLQFHLMNPDVR
ncbi:MAG TPA: carboxypeptidase-like regulatory domain-containing protein [Terriglobales bacterium]